MIDIARVDGRYALEEEMGTGSYAKVYRARDIITKQFVAVKLESATRSHLEHEYRVLSELQDGAGEPGLPRPLWFGREGMYQVMVIDKLGPSLDKVLKTCSDGVFPLHRVATLGLQLVSRLEFIHSRNFVHRDIKPQNLLMGTADDADTIFIIDFGIAKEYRDPSSRIHIPMVKGGRLIGTPAFTSVNGHLGLELSRRDDIEALAYTLLFLYAGSLPWLGLRDDHRPSSAEICASKELVTTGCTADMPMEVLAILSYARNLSFTQKPNYEYLRTILLPATSSLAVVVKETKKISAGRPPHIESRQDDDESKQGVDVNTPKRP